MTKVEAVEMFKNQYEDIKKAVKADRVAVITEWGFFTDMLCKDGEISSNQYNNWANPFDNR